VFVPVSVSDDSFSQSRTLPPQYVLLCKLCKRENSALVKLLVYALNANVTTEVQ